MPKCNVVVEKGNGKKLTLFVDKELAVVCIGMTYVARLPRQIIYPDELKRWHVNLAVSAVELREDMPSDLRNSTNVICVITGPDSTVRDHLFAELENLVEAEAKKKK